MCAFAAPKKKLGVETTDPARDGGNRMSAFCGENEMIRTGVYPRRRKRSKGESETTFPIAVVIELSKLSEVRYE